jgi:hypothetical protein
MIFEWTFHYILHVYFLLYGEPRIKNYKTTKNKTIRQKMDIKKNQDNILVTDSLYCNHYKLHCIEQADQELPDK